MDRETPRFPMSRSAFHFGQNFRGSDRSTGDLKSSVFELVRYKISNEKLRVDIEERNLLPLRGEQGRCNFTLSLC